MCRNAKNFFVQRLKEIQGESSNVEFAKKCGLNTQDIQRYTQEKASPTIDKLFKIANANLVSSDWLIGLSDEKKGGVSKNRLNKNVQDLKDAALKVCSDADTLSDSVEKLKKIIE